LKIFRTWDHYCSIFLFCVSQLKFNENKFDYLLCNQKSDLRSDVQLTAEEVIQQANDTCENF